MLNGLWKGWWPAPIRKLSRLDRESCSGKYKDGNRRGGNPGDTKSIGWCEKKL